MRVPLEAEFSTEQNASWNFHDLKFNYYRDVFKHLDQALLFYHEPTSRSPLFQARVSLELNFPAQFLTTSVTLQYESNPCYYLIKSHYFEKSLC